jgi:hypothetical protein
MKLLIGGFMLLVPPQYLGQVGSCLSLAATSPRKLGHGIAVPPRTREHQGQIVVRPGQIRFALNRVSKSRFGFSVTAL